MSAIDIAQLDLNLLRSLDALLQERSVTRAARRVGLTQSSMSHNLARLREALGDALLVRAGRGMVPTSRAEAMTEPLHRLLAEMGRLLRDEAAFDPLASTREFVLASPDLLASFLPDLLGRMGQAAPGVTMRVSHPPDGDVRRALLDQGADLALAPPRADAGQLMQRRLGAITWAVFGRCDHPAFAGRFTRKRWLAHPHVVVQVGTPGPGWIGGALREAGLTRRIGLRVPSFLLAPLAVRQSDLLFTAPRELVAPLAAELGLASRPVPLPVPAVPVMAYWPARRHDDDGHRWFRRRVAEVVQAVAPGR